MCAELTPYLHSLLLLRDKLREDLGLPGGFHDPARPDAYDQLSDDLRALWCYRSGSDTSNATAGGGGGRGGLAATLGGIAGGAGPFALGSGAASSVFSTATDHLGPCGQPPLVVAASRGNVDAVHLLLLFGEGMHGRRKGNEKALYAACEQGNVAVVAALLGRVPLRPPLHLPHIARRLGLIRRVWSVYSPGHGQLYASGVAFGPQSVGGAIAGVKGRADSAASAGIALSNGGALAKRLQHGSSIGTGAGGSGSNLTSVSPVEMLVSQSQHWEGDGRYRVWCRGYEMGTFWSLIDTALPSYEALHGPIGGPATVVAASSSGDVPLRPGSALRPGLAIGSNLIGSSNNSSSNSNSFSNGPASGTVFCPFGDLDQLQARLQSFAQPGLHRLRADLRLAPGSYSAFVVSLRHSLLASQQRQQQQSSSLLSGGRGRGRGPVSSSLSSPSLLVGSMAQELEEAASLAPADGSSSGGAITSAFMAHAILTSRLPSGAPLTSAARPRPRGHLHPAIPQPIDYGALAACAVGLLARTNAGPAEGRTPLHVACEK